MIIAAFARRRALAIVPGISFTRCCHLASAALAVGNDLAA